MSKGMNGQSLYRKIIAGGTGAWSNPIRAGLRAGEVVYAGAIAARNGYYDRRGPRAVLPVPVCAWPATSFPASESGKTFSWIGVQVVKPTASMPWRTSLERCSE